MFGNDDEAGWSPQRRHTRGKVATAAKPIYEAALKLTAECVAVPQYDASVQLTMANQLAVSSALEQSPVSQQCNTVYNNII